MSNDPLKKIKRILFEEWDPIGINSNKELSDEYDSYASQLCALGRKKDIESIVDLLRRIEECELELPSNSERNLQVARRIAEVSG